MDFGWQILLKSKITWDSERFMSSTWLPPLRVILWPFLMIGDPGGGGLLGEDFLAFLIASPRLSVADPLGLEKDFLAFFITDPRSFGDSWVRAVWAVLCCTWFYEIYSWLRTQAQRIPVRICFYLKGLWLWWVSLTSRGCRCQNLGRFSFWTPLPFHFDKQRNF